MSEIEPLNIWVHGKGPNPKKVIIILEELRVPYKTILVADPKADSYTKINPNGRLPAIEDPNNNGLILWESGAIIEYLVETYDKEHKLTFTSGPEKWYLKQYLHFQMSGQGPYYGQAVWFHVFHPEDVPAAKERYKEQMVRVIQVLDKILEGKEWLVGGKCTYADLACVPWNTLIPIVDDAWEKYEIETKYTNFNAWHQRLLARPAVQKGLIDPA
ncbi:glutathione S-transferase [Fusarium acutatum]|uniref:Glutathione S-transferase n=1 Tax=Fusarium acutatum TaxID=78861 RepID=A0A8H4JFD6_9HYPO|nr:glutathione S-transferase [Fusarium acutatum]